LSYVGSAVRFVRASRAIVKHRRGPREARSG